MELRTLLKILKRYWYLIVIPPLLVGVFTLITYRAPAPGYTSTLRFSVGYAPEQQTDVVVRSQLSGLAHLGIHRRRLERLGQDRRLRAGRGQRGRPATSAPARWPVRSCPIICAASSCSISTAAMRISSPRSALRPSRSCSSATTSSSRRTAQGATVTALDGVVVAPAPLRCAPGSIFRSASRLGLVFGVVLAFVAYYLDPRVRDRADVEAIGLNIIAEIPKK